MSGKIIGRIRERESKAISRQFAVLFMQAMNARAPTVIDIVFGGILAAIAVGTMVVILWMP